MSRLSRAALAKGRAGRDSRCHFAWGNVPRSLRSPKDTQAFLRPSTPLCVSVLEEYMRQVKKETAVEDTQYHDGQLHRNSYAEGVAHS